MHHEGDALRQVLEDPDDFPSDDPRMGALLSNVPLREPGNTQELCRLAQSVPRVVAICHFPYDNGVQRNHGRVGAKDGPAVFLKYVAKVGTVVNVEYESLIARHSCLRIADTANPRLEGNSFDDQRAQHVEHVSQVIQLLNQGTSQSGQHKHIAVPFVVGGGNDQSYYNASALMRNLPENTFLTVINVDAHLDVRPHRNADGVSMPHSGSPFRQLLEDPEFARRHGRFVELGAQGSQCSAAHVGFLHRSNAAPIETKVFWLKDVPSNPGEFTTWFDGKLQTWAAEPAHNANIPNARGVIFLSFDLDAIRGSDAPGVSCASPQGLTVDQALAICYLAGQNPNVAMFDLSEFNPAIDEYRTGRLVAMMFYHFCLGFSKRRPL